MIYVPIPVNILIKYVLTKVHWRVEQDNLLFTALVEYWFFSDVSMQIHVGPREKVITWLRYVPYTEIIVNEAILTQTRDHLFPWSDANLHTDAHTQSSWDQKPSPNTCPNNK